MGNACTYNACHTTIASFIVTDIRHTYMTWDKLYIRIAYEFYARFLCKCCKHSSIHTEMNRIWRKPTAFCTNDSSINLCVAIIFTHTHTHTGHHTHSLEWMYVCLFVFFIFNLSFLLTVFSHVYATRSPISKAVSLFVPSIAIAAPFSSTGSTYFRYVFGFNLFIYVPITLSFLFIAMEFGCGSSISTGRKKRYHEKMTQASTCIYIYMCLCIYGWHGRNAHTNTYKWNCWCFHTSFGVVGFWITLQMRLNEETQ